MAVVMVFKEDVAKLTCGYALQCGRSLEEMIVVMMSELCTM